MITCEVIFNNYFSTEEKVKVINYVEQMDDLHTGMNYCVDVSDAIHRTANVDVNVL